MRKKLFKAVVASAAICFASGMIIANGGIGTVEAANGDEVLVHTFEDGNTDGFLSNGITLSIVDNKGSNLNGADGSGKCMKISNRSKGTDWWERNCLAYDLKGLEPGKTYKISVDFSHDNSAVTTAKGEYNVNRAFKIGTYFTKGYETGSTAEYLAAKKESEDAAAEVKDKGKTDKNINALTEYTDKYTAMYGQIGNVMAAQKEYWETISGTIKIKEDAIKSDGTFRMFVFMGYPEAIGTSGSYKDENIEDYYIDNFSITEYVAPTASPVPATASPVPEASAVPASAVPATAVPIATTSPIVDDQLDIGYEEAIGSITYIVTGTDTVKVKEFDTPKSKLTIPATVTIEEGVYKVTAIDKNAFKGESDIKSLVIGSNVASIGKSAFYNCTSLKKITIKSTSIKSIGSKAFKGTAKKAIVKVPKSKKAAYKKLLKKAGLSVKAKVK